MRRLAGSIALLLLAMPAATQAPTSEPSRAEELDTVLVVGQRPGPALWKVIYRKQVLWILPTLAPLPRQVVWRSSHVEEVLAQSQEVFSEATLTLQLGRDGRPEPSVLAALRNPGEKTLRDVLPPDLYAQFDALRHRYVGEETELDRMRPFFATLELRRRALRNMQLDSDGDVHDSIRYLAKKHVVPLHGLARFITPRPKSLIASLEQIPANADIECARWQMQQLERELREAVARANAWSTGDIAALRHYWDARLELDESASCAELLQTLAPTNRAVRETRDKGYAALRKALRRNDSTLALVSLKEIFDADGVIARFRKEGYGVVEP